MWGLKGQEQFDISSLCQKRGCLCLVWLEWKDYRRTFAGDIAGRAGRGGGMLGNEQRMNALWGLVKRIYEQRAPSLDKLGVNWPARGKMEVKDKKAKARM